MKQIRIFYGWLGEGPDGRSLLEGDVNAFLAQLAERNARNINLSVAVDGGIEVAGCAVILVSWDEDPAAGASTGR